MRNTVQMKKHLYEATPNDKTSLPYRESAASDNAPHGVGNSA